ncbi:hypothetical protein DPMN_174703 [Dreissena polymorpha]|uniref:Uncharacterized protein n=1 Tax=Dreissena polymorpha TaxID=45954 RepID=A0A9D4IHD5_DREPO|nr:hypothetical protein DPMN_174703 [Dreissena polymorpha]
MGITVPALSIAICSAADWFASFSTLMSTTDPEAFGGVVDASEESLFTQSAS